MDTLRGILSIPNLHGIERGTQEYGMAGREWLHTYECRLASMDPIYLLLDSHDVWVDCGYTLYMGSRGPTRLPSKSLI